MSKEAYAQTIDLPSQPAAPLYVENDLTSITVKWLPPSSDGSTLILYYSLEMKPEFENDFEEIYRGYSFSYKVTNLMTGFSYKFRVKAVNKEGEGEVSMSTSSIFTAILPSQPFDLKLKSRSNTHIQISWSSPASSGGLPLTGFKVF